MVDGYPAAGVLSIVRQVIGEMAVQADLALVDELQREQSRELLGDGPEFELGAGVVRNAPFEVGESKALFIDDVA